MGSLGALERQTHRGRRRSSAYQWDVFIAGVPSKQHGLIPDKDRGRDTESELMFKESQPALSNMDPPQPTKDAGAHPGQIKKMRYETPTKASVTAIQGQLRQIEALL